MQTLSTAFLQKLVARLDDEKTLGIALSGSFARGEGDSYSDVDLWHYIRQEPAGGSEIPRLESIDGYLVSVKNTLIEKDYADLRNPQQAIWVVPALRQAQILFDKDGALRLSWRLPGISAGNRCNLRRMLSLPAILPAQPRKSIRSWMD